MQTNPERAGKQRFSKTVDNYIKYRPHYPKAVITLLQEKCHLNKNDIIADIGSGTGIFSKLLLENGNTVHAIEPNTAMREAAESYLSEYPQLNSINASSEQTSLADNSVYIITAAQAFHWFDKSKVHQEFSRILKADGYLVLLWNLRLNRPGIMQGYEDLLQKFGTDYQDVCAEGVTEKSIEDFFSPNQVEIISIAHTAVFDWDGFKGRLLSCSYVPKSGDNNFSAMLDYAETLFKKYQKENVVHFEYETKIYIGQLK